MLQADFMNLRMGADVKGPGISVAGGWERGARLVHQGPYPHTWMQEAVRLSMTRTGPALP